MEEKCDESRKNKSTKNDFFQVAIYSRKQAGGMKFDNRQRKIQTKHFEKCEAMLEFDNEKMIKIFFEEKMMSRCTVFIKV